MGWAVDLLADSVLRIGSLLLAPLKHTGVMMGALMISNFIEFIEQTRILKHLSHASELRVRSIAALPANAK